MSMKTFIMKKFWRLPLLSDESKEKIYYFAKGIVRRANKSKNEDIVRETLEKYVEQILTIPKVSQKYIALNDKAFQRKDQDPKLIAYYLPQYYPFKENDNWWGRGTTEWNNVSRSVPQYLGHYQPRLPGELGFYDLRLKENIVRQVELAKLYGVFAFCYYFYWFDGARLLDRPLDTFLETTDIDFPFCLCWANESWTRRFDGTSGEVIMQQSSTVESYRNFIYSIVAYIKDKRYLEVEGKKVLIIYKPSLVPDCERVIHFWREYCRKAGGGDLYIIGVKERGYDKDLIASGYDAVTEFHPGTILDSCVNITSKVKSIRQDFYGDIFDYADVVKNKRYFQYDFPKLYRSVMPMWDNTARRDNKGLIFDGAVPELYEQWLTDIIQNTKAREDVDDNLVFVNAWNEWGEGAYLEPDRYYGYAFLQATRNAIEKTRYKNEREV